MSANNFFFEKINHLLIIIAVDNTIPYSLSSIMNLKILLAMGSNIEAWLLGTLVVKGMPRDREPWRSATDDHTVDEDEQNR